MNSDSPTPATDAPPVAPAMPTFADQVAAIDVQTVAALIMHHGKRRAVQASTVEIVAMAAHLCQLTALANLTCAMFQTFDKLEVETDHYRRIALRSAGQTQVNMVGEALEALGYGHDETTQPTTTEETTNG